MNNGNSGLIIEAIVGNQAVMLKRTATSILVGGMSWVIPGIISIVLNCTVYRVSIKAYLTIMVMMGDKSMNL
jgi:hypothetical protein